MHSVFYYLLHETSIWSMIALRILKIRQSKDADFAFNFDQNLGPTLLFKRLYSRLHQDAIISQIFSQS